MSKEPKVDANDALEDRLEQWEWGIDVPDTEEQNQLKQTYRN